MRRRHACAALVALLLAGCTTPVPAPAGLPLQTLAALAWPRRAMVTETVPGASAAPSVFSVVAQREADALRWLRFDLMGVPDARQTLRHGSWHNDGLIYPNLPARTMFAALLFAWTPQHALDAVWGHGNWRMLQLPDGGHERALLDRGRVRWTVRWPAGETAGESAGEAAGQSTGLDIHLPDGTRWQVRPWPQTDGAAP